MYIYIDQNSIIVNDRSQFCVISCFLHEVHFTKYFVYSGPAVDSMAYVTGMHTMFATNIHNAVYDL